MVWWLFKRLTEHKKKRKKSKKGFESEEKRAEIKDGDEEVVGGAVRSGAPPTSLTGNNYLKQDVSPSQPRSHSPQFETYQTATVRCEYPNLRQHDKNDGSEAEKEKDEKKEEEKEKEKDQLQVRNETNQQERQQSNHDPSSMTRNSSTNNQHDHSPQAQSSPAATSSPSPVSSTSVAKPVMDVNFHIRYRTDREEEVIRVVGSIKELGHWEVSRAPVMERSDRKVYGEDNVDNWNLSLSINPQEIPSLEYKYVVSDEQGTARRWESGENRLLSFDDKETIRKDLNDEWQE